MCRSVAVEKFARAALIAAGLLATAPSAAVADRICDELWFSRNWVMDQAGYCFGSALGRALFDNADCTGQQVTLTPAQTAFVTEIRHRETALGCSVNTAQTTLNMPDLALRKRLSVQPLPHEDFQGWGCLGYIGPQVRLHEAPDRASAQVGRITGGDWVSVGGFEAVNGWMYVLTYGPSWGSFLSGGWMPTEPMIRCEAEAG